MSAASWAADQVAAVRDDPDARLRLMASLYSGRGGHGGPHLPYRRAALAFMGWQLRRGVLRPEPAGSAWWRAVNERLLRDTAEARAALLGYGGDPSSPSAAHSIEFARRPSAGAWYRAHNASIIAAYLDHLYLAEAENHVERFFINLVLVRVLFAHALVAAPSLALGWCRPLAPLLGDPRLGVTGIFMSLSRVLPDTYPLGGELATYLEEERGFGRLLDIGLIRPRLAAVFDWSARELGEPRVATLITGGTPNYAWRDGSAAWDQPPRLVARLVRIAIPPPANLK